MSVVTAFSQAGNAESAGWATYTLVVVLNASLITGVTGTPTRIRARLYASASGQNFGCDGLYVGHKAGSGDAYDAVSLTQMLVAGSGSFTAPAGSYAETDWCNFVWDKTSALVFSFHCSGGTSADDLRQQNSLAGAATYYKQLVSEAATANKTAYATSGTSEAHGILQVDIEMAGGIVRQMLMHHGG